MVSKATKFDTSLYKGYTKLGKIMAFFNWNLMTPAIPTFYTYILQPSFTPVTFGVASQQLLPIQLTQELKVVPTYTQENISNNNNIPEIKIKEENANEHNTNWDVITIKEEPDVDQDTKNWFQVPVKEEKEEVNEQEKIQVPIKKEKNSKNAIPDEKKRKKSRNSSKRSKSFICDHCSYTTDWKGNLTKHIVSRHTALEEIQWLQCDHCPYKGKTKDYLKCHLLHVHDISVKWYNCPYCSFKAKLKNHLDRHIIVNHTQSEQIQWFPCNHCSYKAKFKTNLKQHVLSKHTESSEIQWFHCDYCNFKAKRKRNLKFHQLNKHTDADKIEWFQCDFCAYKFKRRPAMKVHMATAHGGEKGKKGKPKTREIPVFIENRLCWKRIVVDSGTEEGAFKCMQCTFETFDKEFFKKHVVKTHTVTELKKEHDCIVKKTFKTKDVVVIVDNVPCVKKVVDIQLSRENANLQ